MKERCVYYSFFLPYIFFFVQLGQMSLTAMGWLQNSLGLDITGEWNHIVHINVGGVAYTCVKKTFQAFQDNPLFSQIINQNGRRAEDGSLVIDRDGTTFRHVLNYMRLGALIVPDDFSEWELLLDDARFYQLKGLEEAIVANFAYQQRTFKKNLPQAVYLRWDTSSGGIDLVPPLPAFLVESGSVLRYQSRQVTNVDEAVAILLSTYGFHLEHWHRENLEKGTKHTIFLTLSN